MVSIAMIGAAAFKLFGEKSDNVDAIVPHPWWQNIPMQLCQDISLRDTGRRSFPPQWPWY